MPNAFGGSSTDKDYAPHMWIGDDFVWNTAKSLQVGKWEYTVGRTSEEKIVCERTKVKDDWRETTPPSEIVPLDKIPREVMELAKQISYASMKAGNKRSAEQFKR